MKSVTTIAVILILLTSGIIPNIYQNAEGAESFINVDISETDNQTDFPYGITCEDSTYVYQTISKQGDIAKIDKSTKTVTLIDHPDGKSSGIDAYDIERIDSNGKLVMNQRDNGVLDIYDPLTDTWDRIPIVKNYDNDNANIEYADYTNKPYEIKLTEGGGHGFHTYLMSANSFGGIVESNDLIWVAMNYSFDFDSEGEQILADQSFNGIVKVNPTTKETTFINISGATDVRGVSVDFIDSNVLWITSQADDKVYKFSTTSESVVETITLSAGSNPRGITTDDTHVYVALNKSGGSGNSEILQIQKSDTSVQNVIDTGASNSSSGTFTVFYVSSNDAIMWTDESKHVGSYLIPNGQKLFSTTTFSDANHYGCQVGDEFWFAGKGSVTVGITSIPTFDGTGGNNDSWKTRPTYGKSHQTDFQMVENGFEWLVDNKSKQSLTITEPHHVDFDIVGIETGTPNTFWMKSYQQYGLMTNHMAFGCDPIGTHDYSCEVIVEIFHKYPPTIYEYDDIPVFHNGEANNDIKVRVLQDREFIDVDKLTISVYDSKCKESSQNEVCIKTGLYGVVFNEELKEDVVRISAMDDNRRPEYVYLNDGIDVYGENYNPSISRNIVVPFSDKKGLTQVTEVDRVNGIWVDESNKKYKKLPNDAFVRITPIIAQKICEDNLKVVTRNHCEFEQLKKTEINKATQYLTDAYPELFIPEFEEIDNIFAFKLPDIDSRTKFIQKHNLSWLRD